MGSSVKNAGQSELFYVSGLQGNSYKHEGRLLKRGGLLLIHLYFYICFIFIKVIQFAIVILESN